MFRNDYGEPIETPGQATHVDFAPRGVHVSKKRKHDDVHAPRGRMPYSSPQVRPCPVCQSGHCLTWSFFSPLCQAGSLLYFPCGGFLKVYKRGHRIIDQFPKYPANRYPIVGQVISIPPGGFVIFRGDLPHAGMGYQCVQHHLSMFACVCLSQRGSLLIYFFMCWLISAWCCRLHFYFCEGGVLPFDDAAWPLKTIDIPSAKAKAKKSTTLADFFLEPGSASVQVASRQQTTVLRAQIRAQKQASMGRARAAKLKKMSDHD